MRKNLKCVGQMIRSRQEYVDILRSNAKELQTRFGIQYMRIFGSVAREQHHNDSDIDLYVVMPANAYNLCAAADYIEALLDCNVDLIRKHRNMRPFFLNQIQKYGVDVFGEA